MPRRTSSSDSDSTSASRAEDSEYSVEGDEFSGDGDAEFSGSLSEIEGGAEASEAPEAAEKPGAKHTSEESEEEILGVPHGDMDADGRLIIPVVRLPREERRTSSMLSLYEYAEILSTRISQIEKHPTHFAKSSGTSAREIAIAELNERRCPLKLIRRINQRDGVIYEEEWQPNEMAHPIFIDQ